METRELEQPIGGLIVEPLLEQDWIFGGVERPVINLTGDWRLYKPNPERQATKWFDPYSCVSESLTNALEELLNKMMADDPSVRPVLEKLQMLDDDGKANLSARLLAVMSGTVPGRGNSQRAVFECLRKSGIVGEKVWPSSMDLTQAQYFATVPNEIKEKAKEFTKYFTFEYEAVGQDVVASNDQLKEALKKGPLVVCVGGTYIGNISGASLYRNSGPVSYVHQVNDIFQERDVEEFTEKIPVIHHIFDTYDPFDKRFYPNYPFGFCKIIYLKKNFMMGQLYKKEGESAICVKHWSEDALIAFSDGILPGGDLFKSIYGIKDYSELPRTTIPVGQDWPFPIRYHFTTTGLISNF